MSPVTRVALVLGVAGAALAGAIGLRWYAADLPPADLPHLSQEELEARADVEPRNHWLQLELGARYTSAGADEAAVRCLDRCLALAPDTARAHLYLGIIHQRRGEIPEAVQRLERAAGLAPTLAEAWRELARACYRLNNTRRALAAIEQYLRLAPNDAEGYYVRGSLLAHEGMMLEAEQSYERAVRLDPRRGASQLALGQCYLYSRPSPKRLERAERCFETALRLEPAAADVCYHLGLVQLRQRQWQRAATTLERALRLDPAFPQSHYALAQAYLRLGKRQAAQRHLDRFEQLRSRPPGRKAT